MPEPTVKPYKATSIEELKKIAEEPNERLRKIINTQESAVDMITKLYESAKAELANEDQEMAYILFTRCMNCYVHLQRNIKNFDEKYFKIMHGKQIMQALKHCDELDAMLRKCYEQSNRKLNNCDELKKLTLEVKPIDNSSNGILKKATEHSPRYNGIEELSSTEKRVYISCKELFFSHVENTVTPNSTLIIDIRSKEDFHSSSIKLNDVINIPEDKLSPGLTAPKLESCLEERFKAYFRRRGEYNQIVIYDWFSTKAVPGTKIHQMLTILIKWDVKNKYKSDPLILEGGFEEWHARYPTWTTNPLVKPPEKVQNDSRFLLDKINYPMNEVFETEHTNRRMNNVSIGVLKPTIDRSTKPPIPQEKKTEILANVEETIRNENADVGTPDHSTDVKNETSTPKANEIRVEEKNETLESDEETKNQYYQGGRRSALISIVNQGLLYKKINGHADDEDTKSKSRNEESDEDESRNATIPNSCQSNENSSKMKRCSSTPNISKLISAENDKPLVDRSTKPSNDDQLNYYTMGCKYNNMNNGLTGLKNIGNTCYMNSIIQCLSNTELLSKKFCDPKFRPVNENSKTRGAVAREVASIIKQLWMGDGNPVSCRSLKNIIGQYNDMFSGHDQQDSHEFLTILIDWLHEDLNEPHSKGVLDGAEESSGEKAWGEFTRKNNSIVRQLFYGQLRSTVSCRTCKKQSITFEPFSNLSLPLPAEETEICTLADCLRLYISSDDVDKWQCPGCRDLRRATKKLDITRLPPILVIHFKRFTSIGGCKKQRTFVDFPDKLDMRPFIIGQEQRFSQYELYAVSNHSGSMESGHYTAYCKNPMSQRWYEFDDQNVYVMPKPLRSKEAYIVFYQCVKN